MYTHIYIRHKCRNRHRYKHWNRHRYICGTKKVKAEDKHLKLS